MVLEKLNDWPSHKTTKYLVILGIILSIFIFLIMAYFFLLSGFPVSFTESQLSFSGSKMKEYYSITDINYYRIVETLDYAYMVGYGTFAFSLLSFISQLIAFPSASKGLSHSTLNIFCGSSTFVLSHSPSMLNLPEDVSLF